MSKSTRTLFSTLENSDAGTKVALEQMLAAMPWDHQGLLPVIAQDSLTREVLMLAWANRQALEMSLQLGKAHYWSRSRQSIWCKGETSGHTQAINSIHLDCDGDAILYLVQQTGPACHTNRRQCFYWQLDQQGAVLTA